jgi:type I restriction enzyme R subunit
VEKNRSGLRFTRAYLQRIADIATNVQAGKAEHTPVKLDSPGKRAVFNNIKNSPALSAATVSDADDPYCSADSEDEPALVLAQKIDNAVKVARPDGWRGVQAKELVIKRAL